MKYLIGNWKSNFNLSEAKDWLDAVKPNFENPDNLKVVLCPGFIHLPLFQAEFPNLSLGVQYISPFPKGAYTGQISGDMISDLVSFCITGHSERRRYFKESNQDISNQVDQAQAVKITPIISVDQDNWHSQLSIISKDKLKKSIIMYEPPEAISQQTGPIGEGNAAPIDEVVEKIKEIKEEFPSKAVIYGGSVKSHNIKEFISHPQIDGVLPGSASLNPEEWLKMIELASDI
jgi:triosephosphate isomerase